MRSMGSSGWGIVRAGPQARARHGDGVGEEAGRRRTGEVESGKEAGGDRGEGREKEERQQWGDG